MCLGCVCVCLGCVCLLAVCVGLMCVCLGCDFVCVCVFLSGCPSGDDIMIQILQL